MPPNIYNTSNNRRQSASFVRRHETELCRSNVSRHHRYFYCHRFVWTTQFSPSFTNICLNGCTENIPNLKSSETLHCTVSYHTNEHGKNLLATNNTSTPPRSLPSGRRLLATSKHHPVLLVGTYAGEASLSRSRICLPAGVAEVPLIAESHEVIVGVEFDDVLFFEMSRRTCVHLIQEVSRTPVAVSKSCRTHSNGAVLMTRYEL